MPLRYCVCVFSRLFCGRGTTQGSDNVSEAGAGCDIRLPAKLSGGAGGHFLGSNLCLVRVVMRSPSLSLPKLKQVM